MAIFSTEIEIFLAEKEEKCNMMLYFDRNAQLCAIFLREIVLVCYCAVTTGLLVLLLFLWY